MANVQTLILKLTSGNSISRALLPKAQVPRCLLNPGWPQLALEKGSRVSLPAGQPNGLPPKMPQPPPRLGALPGAAQGTLLSTAHFGASGLVAGPVP